MKLFITYGGTDSNGNWYFPYKAVVSSIEEAEQVINSWHSYGGSKKPLIVLNAKCREKIANCFQNGFEVNPYTGKTIYLDLRTSGCGSWSIRVYPALADTLEEHERIYNERREAEKAERMRKSQEAKKLALEDFNVQREGWYYVEVEVCGLTVDLMRPRYFISSGYGIAKSKMDAYSKFIGKGYINLINQVAGKGLTFADCSEWNSSDTNVEFLGMKTDDGYSVEAWEEWKKQNERDSSIKSK